MALDPAERETIITFSDADGTAQIHTAQRTVITKLTKNKAATLVAKSSFEGTQFAEFTIPASLISFRQQERKQLTDEQRQKMSDAIRKRKPWEQR